MERIEKAWFKFSRGLRLSFLIWASTKVKLTKKQWATIQELSLQLSA
jgi:hypothetical protein